MRPSSWMLLAWSVALLLASAAEAVELGQRAIVIAPVEAQLYQGDRAVEAIRRGKAVRVDEIKAERVLVRHKGQDLWLLKKDLASVADAKEEFTREIAQRPTTRAYVSRGFMHNLEGRPELAIADFNAALAIDPQNYEAIAARGIAFWVLKDFRGALAAYDEAIALCPEKASAYQGRATLYALNKRYAQALADFEACARLETPEAAFYMSRSTAHLAAGKLSLALADLRVAREADPRDPAPYRQQATIHLLRAETEQALQALVEGLKAAPHEASLWQDRANILVATGRYGEAEEFIQQAVKLAPRDTEVLRSRAVLYRFQARYAESIADLEQCAALDPSYVSGYRSHAWLLATCPDERWRNGKQAEALARKACTLSKWKDAGSLGALAAAYAEQGYFDSAVEMQQEMLKLGGTEAGADQERLELYQAKKPVREIHQPQSPAGPAAKTPANARTPGKQQR